MDANSEFVTTKEAAVIANRSYASLERWTYRGPYDMDRLATVQVGHVRLIRRDVLDAYLSEVATHEDGRTLRHRAEKAAK